MLGSFRRIVLSSTWCECVVVTTPQVVTTACVHGRVLRNRAVSLMQQLRDELRICRRNMVAEQKNSGRVDKHVRK